MAKEVSIFRTKYLNFLKNNNANADVCNWLESATDFERPDGYYWDSNNLTLIIFEHFRIDCSELIIKNNKSVGSTLCKNFNDKYHKVQKEIEKSNNVYYESTKMIEQGYYKKCDDKIIIKMGENGDKYRDNFISNFEDSFRNHEANIKNYKQRIIDNLKIHPAKIIIIFLVEDKTNMGTFYLKNKNSKGEPVILTDTLQFQNIIDNSNVDYVISAREFDKKTFIGHKKDLNHKIDLNETEFYIIPIFPFFTFSQKI